MNKMRWRKEDTNNKIKSTRNNEKVMSKECKDWESSLKQVETCWSNNVECCLRVRFRK